MTTAEAICPKKPPSSNGCRHNGASGIFRFDIKPGSVAYRYDIEITRMIKRGNNIVEKSLTKSTDDGMKAKLGRLCQGIMEIAYDMADAFGMDESGRVVYDCRKALWTSQPMPIEEDEASVHITPARMAQYDSAMAAEMGNCDVLVTIKPVSVLNLTDLSQYISGETAKVEDRSLRAFLGLLVSQMAVQAPYETYSRVGSGNVFIQDPTTFTRLGNGMVLRRGVRKGVRIIEDNGRPAAALVIDAKASAFFASQNLAATVREICGGQIPPAGDRQWIRVAHILRDVRVAVSYQSSRSFCIKSFTDSPIREITVPTGNGGAMNLLEYFASKPQNALNLELVDAPAVIPDYPVPRGQQKPTFPLEVLVILPDQRVPLSKMTEQLAAVLLDANSSLPDKRLEEIMLHGSEHLKIFGNENVVLQGFGVSLIANSNTVPIKVRDLPAICYAERPGEKPFEVRTDSTWRPWRESRYVETMPEPLKTWAVLCSPRYNQTVRTFIKDYLQFANGKGMRLTQPTLLPFEGRAPCEFDAIFKKLFDDNVPFVMLIDPMNWPTHDLLKFYERHSQVLTQHVSLERVQDVVVKHQSQTMLNIVNKTNCKLFGTNYVPVMKSLSERYRLESGLFVIGYDVNHPSPVSGAELARLRKQGCQAIAFDPSVVGIAANAAGNPNAFVGDFFFQEARCEDLDGEQLARKMAEALTMLEKSRPQHKLPRIIVVVRDGVSEGQYRMVFEQEYPAIQAGCNMYRAGYRPQFVFVISSKRHSKRFFSINDSGRFENPMPGSVVDEKVVRPDVTEFFMQPHKPLKGTSKMVEYSVIVNDTDMNTDDVQDIMLGLCYNHQIVSRAVSIPEPVYQADELAKRGRNFLREMKNSAPESIPYMPTGIIDGRELSAMVSYAQTWMAATRFTA
ncbi:piwi domain-containing protein [Aphelenchoides avenae]|nr:piwi domain-containing protein [Aphelenchus avenae]